MKHEIKFKGKYRKGMDIVILRKYQAMFMFNLPIEEVEDIMKKGGCFSIKGLPTIFYIDSYKTFLIRKKYKELNNLC